MQTVKIKAQKKHSERTLNTDPEYFTEKEFLESKLYPFFPRQRSAGSSEV